MGFPGGVRCHRPVPLNCLRQLNRASSVKIAPDKASLICSQRRLGTKLQNFLGVWAGPGNTTSAVNLGTDDAAGLSRMVRGR
eukprot:2764976-Pyramimonas_sp.AAC.1